MAARVQGQTDAQRRTPRQEVQERGRGSWAPWKSRAITPVDSHSSWPAHEDVEGEVAAGGFENTVQRAREEGLDVFAPAPQLTYRDMTRLLHPVHWQGTGMVQSPLDAKRLDACLAPNYFQRPSWNTSIVPEPAERSQSHEAVARQIRGDAFTDLLKQTAIRGGCTPVCTPRGNRPLGGLVPVGTPRGQTPATPAQGAPFLRPNSGRTTSSRGRASPAIGHPPSPKCAA